MSRLVCLTTVAALAVTGCSLRADPALVLTSALVSFDECDDVLRYLKDAALERVGPYGLGDAGGSYYGRATEETVVPGPSAQDSAGAAEAPSYSPTNVQEAGVDEPDIVKTDGAHIVSVVDGTLRVFDATSGAALGSLALVPDAADEPGPTGIEQPSFDVQGSAELLLAGDRALVLVERGGFGIADERLPRVGGGSPFGSELVMVDLSAPAQPRQVARLTLSADVVSARVVDGVVRVAVRAQPTIVFPWDDELADDETALTERNRELIERSELADWVPSSQWTSGDASEDQLLTPCDRLSYPPTFAGFSTVSVLSLPMDGDLREAGATGVLGSGDTVYASPERFYVVSNDWSSVMTPAGVPGGVAPAPAPEIGDAAPETDAGSPLSQDLTIAAAPAPLAVSPIQVDTRTSIHAFDISEPGPARYVGSGTVGGRLLGQYALSEWEGNLRVATTLPATGGSGESRSRVTVLAEQDGELTEIGMVDGLGVGEEIYAVRYLGATAYVVTFRQTDPLYVVDLTDPTEPVVRGSLKIKGYSAYLHPIGDGLVIGVGQDAHRSGVTKGAQVSLFDVSNPAEPVRLSSDTVPDGWTGAEWDARAFLYWDATGDVVLPMRSNSRDGALVLSVAGRAVAERGWVTAAGSHDSTGGSVRRSMVIGDRLFTVWDDGIQSNDLATLDELGWTPFRA